MFVEEDVVIVAVAVAVDVLVSEAGENDIRLSEFDLYTSWKAEKTE